MDDLKNILGKIKAGIKNQGSKDKEIRKEFKKIVFVGHLHCAIELF